ARAARGDGCEQVGLTPIGRIHVAVAEAGCTLEPTCAARAGHSADVGLACALAHPAAGAALLGVVHGVLAAIAAAGLAHTSRATGPGTAALTHHAGLALAAHTSARPTGGGVGLHIGLTAIARLHVAIAKARGALTHAVAADLVVVARDPAAATVLEIALGVDTGLVAVLVRATQLARPTDGAAAVAGRGRRWLAAPLATQLPGPTTGVAATDLPRVGMRAAAAAEAVATGLAWSACHIASTASGLGLRCVDTAQTRATCLVIATRGCIDCTCWVVL